MSEFNAELFAIFYNKMEWEGGIAGVIEYGWSGGTGDRVLDRLYDQLDTLIFDFNHRMGQLMDIHEDKITALLEDEYE